MARKKKKEPQAVTADAPDLTPMIDITFQLVVFFLVANDLSQKEIEIVKLPQALAGVEDLAQEKERIIVNIRPPKEGEPAPKYPDVMIKGKAYDLKALENQMRVWADKNREPPGGPNAPSELFVLVRADKAAPWSHVQYVMQACAAQGVGVYKMQFATTKRDDGKASTAADAK